MPFNAEKARQDGYDDKEIAEFLAKKFNHAMSDNYTEIINKLSLLDPADRKKIDDMTAIDEAVEDLKDIKQNEDGLFPFNKNKFNKCLEEYANEKSFERITEFTNKIKLVEAPTIVLTKQIDALLKTPLGKFVFTGLDPDNDIQEDMLNPFFSLRVVMMARNSPSNAKIIDSLLKTTKGVLNSLVTNSSLNLLINDARPKFMKHQLEQSKQLGTTPEGMEPGETPAPQLQQQVSSQPSPTPQLPGMGTSGVMK